VQGAIRIFGIDISRDESRESAGADRQKRFISEADFVPDLANTSDALLDQNRLKV